MPRILVIIALLLMFFSISKLHALELTERDNGQTVKLQQGEILTLNLEGNPTTGYMWEAAGYNKNLLVMQGESGFLRDAERPGSGGRFVFRFEPKGTGETRLQLVYIRPWAKKDRPIRTFEVVVSILGEEGDYNLQKNYQPLFKRSDDDGLLRISRIERIPPSRLTGEVAAPVGFYSAAKERGTENLVVLRGSQTALKISVPAFAKRPLDVRWLNAKLLYMELWFDPHNGIYWIFDIEREALLMSELMNDGM